MRISDWSSDVCSSDLLDILRDRHPAKNRGFLRQIAKAKDRAAIHRQRGDVGAVEHDAPGVGLYQPHDRIEAGRLALAVRSQEPDSLTLADRERYVDPKRTRLNSSHSCASRMPSSA